jgi:hypothetical protein
MRAYSLEVGASAQPRLSPQDQSARPESKARGIQKRWPAVAAALVLAVLAAGTYAWHSGVATRLLGASVEDKLANAPRLSIVVLPFENLSSDRDETISRWPPRRSRA